jgi:hypothetical protein
MLLAAKRVLGLASLGLGIAAVVAPEGFARMLGLDKDAESVSAFGAREIAAGSGLLSPVRPGPWLWMRVGGDLMDAFALRTAVHRDNPRRRVAIAATAVLALIAMADFALAFHASTHRHEDEKAAA